jgi:hypothetical protein
MRKRPAALLVGAILILCVAASGSSRTHNGYYTCLPGTLTALVLTNASEYASDEAFTATVYDAHGTPMVSITDSLESYESKVLFLNEHIPEIDEFCWGSVNIDSELLLQVGLWLGTEDEWVSVSNLNAKTLSTEGYDVVYYWYGVNYANTANRRTGVGLVNPGGGTIRGTTYVYDASGAPLSQSDFELSPHQSLYFKPETIFPIDGEMWGLIDVRASSPIIVAAEYFDANDRLIDVDIINNVYYLQVQSTENGDSP